MPPKNKKSAAVPTSNSKENRDTHQTASMKSVDEERDSMSMIKDTSGAAISVDLSESPSIISGDKPSSKTSSKNSKGGSKNSTGTSGPSIRSVQTSY